MRDQGRDGHGECAAAERLRDLSGRRAAESSEHEAGAKRHYDQTPDGIRNVLTHAKSHSLRGTLPETPWRFSNIGDQLSNVPPSYDPTPDLRLASHLRRF